MRVESGLVARPCLHIQPALLVLSRPLHMCCRDKKNKLSGNCKTEVFRTQQEVRTRQRVHVLRLAAAVWPCAVSSSSSRALLGVQACTHVWPACSC